MSLQMQYQLARETRPLANDVNRVDAALSLEVKSPCPISDSIIPRSRGEPDLRMSILYAFLCLCSCNEQHSFHCFEQKAVTRYAKKCKSINPMHEENSSAYDFSRTGGSNPRFLSPGPFASVAPFSAPHHAMNALVTCNIGQERLVARGACVTIST